MIRLLSISVFLFLSLHASATTLIVEDSLLVKEIDNQVFSQSFLSQKTTFKLTKGQHAVVIKYKDVYEDLDFGQEELVESILFVAKFSSNDETVITIKTPIIKNLKVAKYYAKMPKVIVTDSKNNQLSVEHQTYSEYKTEREVSNVLANIAKVTPIDTGVALTQSTEKVVIAAIVASKRKKASKIKKTSLKGKTQDASRMNHLLMLEYWWQQASDEEKAIFKQQIKVK